MLLQTCPKYKSLTKNRIAFLFKYIYTAHKVQPHQPINIFSKSAIKKGMNFINASTYKW